MEQVYLPLLSFILLLVIGNYILTFAIIRKLNSTPKLVDNGLASGTTAPDFTAIMFDGKQVIRSDYEGTNLLLLFISPFCKPCRASLDLYLSLIPFAERRNIRLRLVCLSNLDDARALADEFKIKKEHLLVPSSEGSSFAKDYKVNVTPSYCFINEEGIVQSSGYPGSEESSWKELIEKWAHFEIPA